MVHAIEPAVAFYKNHLGFDVKPGWTPNFAIVARGALELILSTPFGPGSAARPMADGRTAEPGGWNRIIIDVADLASEVERLRANGLHFRSEIVSGVGGSQIIVDDPSGNPVELFQAAR
jgi:catechol 2,3-dioxygenase-like lactoylglutathione lyase family enzyme